MVLIVVGDAQQCSENFSPCTCTPFSVGVVNIDCYQQNIDDIKSTFDTTSTTDLIRLVITLPSDSTSIPTNLLGNNKASDLSLTCVNPTSELNIEADAFRSSQTSTLSLSLRNCNLKQLDFSFLIGFGTLYEIIISDSTFPTTFNTLPSLPSLYYLIITNCHGFQSWGNPDLSHVHELYLQNNLLTDDSAAEILNSIASSSNLLATLQLSMNKLTRVPEAVHLLEKLETLNLDGNTIPIITSSSLAFVSSEIVSVRLEDLSLTKIEVGAFQGNFLIHIIF